MAFTIPTLSTLIDRIKGDMNSRMGNQNALIRRSFAFAVSHTMAAATWGLYLYLQWLGDQIIPDTAESEQLVRWARLFGIPRSPTTSASGPVTVTATSGSDLLDGTKIQRADSVEYEVVGDYHWTTSGDKTVTISAIEGGLDGNFEYVSGATLDLISPPAGVVSTVVLESAGLTGGNDEETDGSLLNRLLVRLANPPQGGARSDYELWARSTPGVRADLVFVQGFREGVTLGQVRTLFTVVDTADNGTVIPSSGDVAAVLAVIEPLAPVDCEPLVVAPVGTTVTIAVTAKLLPGVTTPVATANIRRSIQGKIRLRAIDEFSNSSWTVPNSDVRDGIDDAVGLDYYTLNTINGGTPSADLTLTGNHYPTIVDANITLTAV